MRRLLARAAVARKEVSRGRLDGELALSYVLWPTVGIREAERQVSPVTLASRIDRDL